MKKARFPRTAVSILIVTATAFLFGWLSSPNTKTLQTHFLLEQPYCNSFVVFWLEEEEKNLHPQSSSSGVWIIESGDFSAILRYAEKDSSESLYFWSMSSRSGPLNAQEFRATRSGSFPATNAMITAQDGSQSSDPDVPRIGYSQYELREGIACEGAQVGKNLQELFQRLVKQS